MFNSTLSKQLLTATLNYSIRTCMVLAFVACASFGFGQIVDSPEYQDAKANGTLPSEDLSVPFSGSQEQLDFFATPLSSSTSSFTNSNPDCFIPIEDDWSELLPNDDGSTSLISLPFTFSMYGVDYTSVYVNNNGNITFVSPFSTYSASGFPISTPMVAPFWGDVDTREVIGEDNGQVRYKVFDHALVVTWDGVAPYSATSGYANDLRNTFQVVITDGTDPSLSAGNNVGFRYGTMDWTTGLASNGVDGFGGFPANVGVNAGNSTDFFQVGLFDQPGTAYDGAFGLNDGVDYLENSCFEFNTADGLNFPPAAQLVPNAELDFCEGEASASYQFIGPENDQNVTITFNSPDGLGYEVVSNVSGAVASATVSFQPTVNGVFTFEAIATDDFDSPASTIISIEVIVDGCASDCEPSLAITCPENVEVNCADDLSPANLGMVIVETSDCTEDAVVTYEDVQVSEEGECPIILNRTFLVQAGDLAELCTQMITLIDTEGPEFVDFEDTITVECLEEVPAPGDYEAVDACSGLTFDAEVFESNTGVLTDECELATAFGPGADWALWLPIFSAEGYATNGNFVFDADGGSFEQYNDGTARLFGTVVNEENANEIFELDLWFDNKSDWATWSSMGRSYKDDLNCATPDALYEDWTYYTLVDGFSTAIGAGDLAGSELYFYHMPADYYFGFQIGQGANNKNCNYGFSGWFTYQGMVDGEPVEGHGDVNVDAECEPANEQDCPHHNEFTYLYRAVDNCGNATVAEQTIVVNDTTGPEFINFPEDLTVDCDDLPIDVPTLEAIDNCVGDVEISGPFMTETPGECANEMVIEYAWSAVDICDNQTNMIWTITVVDTQAPALIIPADVTVECDAVPAAGEATATDNCSEEVNITITLNEETIPGQCAGDYTILRTWTATDECDNSTSLTQTVTVIDTTAPVFDAYEANIDMPCDDISYSIDLSATDNCGSVDVSFEDEASDAGCAGSIIRTYTATDDCGNSATAVQTITLIDNTNPTIDTFPADATVECDSVPAAQGDEVSGSDNCTDTSISYDGEQIIDGACIGDYTILRTWTITDACGNSTSQTQTITVIDTTAPEFTFVPQDDEYSCEEEIPAINAEASDNCGTVEVTWEDAITPGDCPQAYTIARTFTATDDCGNANTATQMIYVYDETAPVFTAVGADMTLECDEELPAAFAEATDNCDEDVTIDVSAEIIDGECPQEYTMIRTYVATDDCGNSTSAQQVLTVVDTTAPEFVDYAYYTAVPCEEIEDYTLEAIDNCGEVTVEIVEEVLNSGGCLGVLHRVYQATDECGNMTEVEQYITITDFIAPELIDVPADETVECDEVPGSDDGTLFGAGDVTAEDNCGGEVELTYSEEVIDGACENAYTVIRTWTAMDYCENVTVASQTVTVEDTTAPEFVEVPADITVECSDELPAVEYPVALDNCDEDVTIEMTTETEAGDCPQEYTLMRIFRGFDNCGNETMHVQNIYVVDTTAPAFTFVPADVTYECDEDIALDMATAADNCGATTVTYMDGEILPGDCPEAYSFVRTFTAVDECGNSASVAQNIYVEDTTAPVVDGEAFLEMPCDMISDEIFVTAEDNCDAEVEITFSDDAVSGGCAGNVIRTYTAVDNCGNSTNFTQVINLIDEVAPEFTAFPVDVTVPCTDVPGVSDDVDAEDNCDEGVEIAYLGEEFQAGDCAGNYTLIRTWSATDNCNNVTERSQTITVVDEEAPVFTAVPSDATYECDEEIPAINAEASDNCGTVVVTWADASAPGECANASIITRTFTATDDCGNASTATQTIFVVDTTAPEFTFVPAGDTFECDEEVDYGMAAASDNCGDVTISSSDEIIDGDCPNSYEIVRTWTATDACGNSATASSSYNVEDTTAPVIEGEAQLEMPCDDVDAAIFVTATDNCDLDVEITYEDLNVSGGCAGNILRTYTATDDCGNSSEFTQVINLIDEVAPELEGVPADVTVECGDEIPAPADVTAIDNCDETLEVMFTETTEDNDCLYNIIRTWTVLDHCDNVASASQTITIVDTTAPSLDTPADSTIECSDDVPAAAYEVYDACDQEVTVTVSEEMTPGSCDGEYTVVRTYVATDDCGNSTTNVETISVIDTTAPEITVPAGGTFECDEEVDYGMASGDDNCSDVTITFADQIIAGDCPESYEIVRTWTATDACGNASSDMTSYFVEDTTAPVITAEAQIQMPCDDIDMAIFATATDNCDTDVEITYEDETVSGGCAGNILRNYTATDNCGNSSEYTQIINLIDEVAPELEGVPADLTIECGDNIPAPAEVTAIDNCDDNLVVEFSESLQDNDCLYSIIRTWTVEDHCDNVTTASQTITIVDTTAPVLETPADSTIECDQDAPEASYGVADVCDGDVEVTISEEMIAGDCPNNYSIVRTYVATDDCGNSTTNVETITVVDTTAPEFTAVPNGNEFSCDEEVVYGTAEAMDNCGDVTITSSDEIIAGDCANEYEIHRTWTATDACGNSATAETWYLVYDETAPTFDGSVEDVVVECASEVPATPELTATDNCGDATVTYEMNVVSEDECGNGVTEVIYTATDACGNTAQTSYTITVNDLTAPVLSEMPEDLTIDCDAEVPAAPVVTASDNCVEVIVDFSEEIVGDMPAEGSIADCIGYTAPSPYYDTDWSLWLQAFPGGDEFYTTDNISFIEYADGTATITGEVSSTSTAGGWTIEVTLENGMDWEGWTTQGFPTSYKDDFNVAGENYLDWTYYIVQAGNATLYGTGIYDGDVLNLSHAPANYYYAFQVGIGANNTTAGYGGGGWFYYDGTAEGMDVNGAGDFAFDLDCCPRYEIVRTWTAMDCSGNLVQHTQTISFADLGEEAVADNDDNGTDWADMDNGRDNSVHHVIYPNPTQAKSFITFNNDVDGKTVIEVYSLNGTKVADVFNQSTDAGIDYRAEIDAQDLADGIYLVRIQHAGTVTTDRLIINK